MHINLQSASILSIILDLLINSLVIITIKYQNKSQQFIVSQLNQNHLLRYIFGFKPLSRFQFALTANILSQQYNQSLKNKTMKPLTMRAPALSEIYTQKMLHQMHIKKLQKIRSERKSNISINQNRLVNIQLIKQTKNRSFAHKFNQQSNQINRQNLRLLVRLQQTKPYFRYTSQDNREDLQKSRESRTLATPFLKRRAQDNQKQNSRLSNRVQSVSSSLNQKNMMKDFVKSQRIKQRITRYTQENNKVSLKSQKYVSHMSQSKLSNSSEVSTVRPRIQSTTANYYKREDIMKNKVQNVGKSLLRTRNKLSHTLDQNNEENKQSFFTTQPQKNVGKLRAHRR